MTIDARHALLLFVICTFCFILSSPAQASNQPVTITLPAPTLHQTIRDMLPLPLEQTGEKFQGTITVDSISKLTINDDLISIQGRISGTNMQLTTNIGGQDIKLKLGKLVLPVTCDIFLRYDPAKKNPLSYPEISKSDPRQKQLRQDPAAIAQLSRQQGISGNIG